MATKWPSPYDRQKWPNFISSYEQQVRDYVSQGCDFYFNLLWWRAMRCVPLAVFLRQTMPEFCRGYMGYLFRYFLNGEGKENYYTNDNGVKVSKYTSDFDGRIKERELAKLLMHKAGEEGEEAWRMRGQYSKNASSDSGGFGCARLYFAHESKKTVRSGGNRDAYKGHQYYMQACIEILNNGCCRSGPDSALRKLGIDTRSKAPGWGEMETVVQRMWMLYSPNNSGVYSIHFWPETIHMFIRGIVIMDPEDKYTFDDLADPWNIPGKYPGQPDAVAPWLVGRSIHCFLNDHASFSSTGSKDGPLLARCLKSTAIRDAKLANVETEWIRFEYNGDFAKWWDDFGEVGRNTIIGNAVSRARLGTRRVVDSWLKNGDFKEMAADPRLTAPTANTGYEAIELYELANSDEIERTIKDIAHESGRKMAGHIAKHKHTALDVPALYKHHVGSMPDYDPHANYRPVNMTKLDIAGHPTHLLETIRGLVAGDDGAPPIPDPHRSTSNTNLHYWPRSARQGTSIEAAHTTITNRRVCHLCIVDHLTAEGIIYPEDDGGETIEHYETGEPWTWEQLRSEVIWGTPKNRKLQHWINHNAISAWNDTFFLFAALGDGHFWVDDADGPLEMAIQLGGQRYIFNHGIRKLEQVECLPPLDIPGRDTFVQFWANMVFFALFGGLNPYKEYWLPNPINSSVRVFSLAGMWPGWLEDKKLDDWRKLASYVSAYIDHMMNIQSSTKVEDLDILDSDLFDKTIASRLYTYDGREDIVDDYFPERRLVYGRVMKMIEPYVVMENGICVRKRARAGTIHNPENIKWFHSKNLGRSLYETLVPASERASIPDSIRPKNGGWFKQYWQQVFNGQLEGGSKSRQFKTKNQGGLLAEQEPPDIIYGVVPIKDKTFENDNTSMPYATLNTMMWPHYSNRTAGREQDHAVGLRFYKIQLRNVLDTDGKTMDDMADIIVAIDHKPGEDYLANMYEMALFYQEWHVQTYMFRQVYLDGRDELIGKNCWDGFRAQDRELEKVVRRPCFLKFNDHARQYDRENNEEIVNVGLEPFLLDDEGMRTAFFHRGLESNAIGHCINSKKSATCVQRRMTIGFAEQIQRIEGFGDNKLEGEQEQPVEWGTRAADDHIMVTSIRTPIMDRDIANNVYTSQAKWWSENQLNPMKVKCQPGVVMIRIPPELDDFSKLEDDGTPWLATGLVFAHWIRRHAEMMIGGRTLGPQTSPADGYKLLQEALWNELPDNVEYAESLEAGRPNDPYFGTAELDKKPTPLVRMILNYTQGSVPPAVAMVEEEDDYLYNFKKLKF